MYGCGEASNWTNTPPVYSTPSVHPYSNYDVGPSTSSAVHPSTFFQFSAYPTVPVPFDYPQVIFLIT